MMKKIYIIGAGGFGREVAWLIERINQVKCEWEIIGFIDDNKDIRNTLVGGYPVLGDIDYLSTVSESVYIVCAVGTASTRKCIIDRLKGYNFAYATLVDPSVVMSDRVSIGEGSIVCAGCVLTVDITIGDHVIINLDCTVGHDAKINNFVTIYPSANISGMVTIQECCEIGTGTGIIQGKSIGQNVIIGAGASVVKDIHEKGTYVGVPAKRIK